ncbi:hypothetical protein AUJ14_05095 [Candidatus Micrarchaeota archaeon CG1_02_55_22]|nr:MAG: hypothetical protein AUJ14_05095 [Candidatus Micrarchaeota archaeon CG1_02_55_22]
MLPFSKRIPPYKLIKSAEARQSWLELAQIQPKSFPTGLSTPKQRRISSFFGNALRGDIKTTNSTLSFLVKNAPNQQVNA